MDLDVRGKTILGVGAHPDDLDFGCAGTIAKWIKDGAKAYYLILTDGSKGFEDPYFEHKKLVDLRREEQKEAAQVLGVKDVFFLDFIDGGLLCSHDVYKEIVKVLRQLKPEIVFGWDPTLFYDEEWGRVNHPDHRVAGQATLDAVYPFARNARTYPELLEQGFELHSVSELLLVNFKKSNFFIDITNTFDSKLDALKKHKSQYQDFSTVKQWVSERAQKMGEIINCKYAEGFVRIKISA